MPLMQWPRLRALRLHALERRRRIGLQRLRPHRLYALPQLRWWRQGHPDQGHGPLEMRCSVGARAAWELVRPAARQARRSGPRARATGTLHVNQRHCSPLFDPRRRRPASAPAPRRAPLLTDDCWRRHRKASLYPPPLVQPSARAHRASFQRSGGRAPPSQCAQLSAAAGCLAGGPLPRSPRASVCEGVRAYPVPTPAAPPGARSPRGEAGRGAGRGRCRSSAAPPRPSVSVPWGVSGFVSHARRIHWAEAPARQEGAGRPHHPRRRRHASPELAAPTAWALCAPLRVGERPPPPAPAPRAPSGSGRAAGRGPV